MKKFLTIIPSVPVWINNNSIIFDRKFYDGMIMYKKKWLGSINCIMYKSSDSLPSFGVVEKEKNEIPFDLIILQKNEKVQSYHLKNTSIVLASGDSFDQFYISSLCKKNSIKCIYVIEYIPETRYQIADLTTNNLIVKLRRYFFIWNGERKRLVSFGRADGIQANGTAAYNQYNKFKNCILYFDTRVNTNLIISDEQLNNRLTILLQKKPLRLAFSGRLIEIKGADHLIKLATLLKDRNIDFEMTIYGTGHLEDNMLKEINDAQLIDKVKIMGAVDFYNQLLPEIKANVDLYVILHRQSDPSCTYLETLSCGIPIVGYDNKAFSGLLKMADIGWGKRINDLQGIADIIEYLNMNRELIKNKSINSVNFSRVHSFENTFDERIKHLQQLAA